MIAVTVSTSGNDSGCSRGLEPVPCATFERAYELARCGDIVGVESGDYPAQKVVHDKAKTCSDSTIVIRPISGAVKLHSPNCEPTPIECGALVLGDSVSSVGAPSWLTLRGIRIMGDLGIYGNGHERGDHVTLDHIVGGGGVVSDATNFVLSNSSMGPCQHDDVTPHTTACQQLHLRFAGRWLCHHGDDHQRHLPRLHQSHWRLSFRVSLRSDVTRVVIQRSWFYNCMEGGIQLEYRQTPASVLIQNNWFGQTSNNGGATGECNAIRLSSNAGTQTNTLIRYNSFAHGQGVILASGSPTSGVRIIGNILGLDPADYCATGRVGFSGAVYDSNVWERHNWGVIHGPRRTSADCTSTAATSEAGTTISFAGRAPPTAS